MNRMGRRCRIEPTIQRRRAARPPGCRSVPGQILAVVGRAVPWLWRAIPNSPTCERPTTPWMIGPRQRLAELAASTPCSYSRQAVGFADFTPEEIQQFPARSASCGARAEATGRTIIVPVGARRASSLDGRCRSRGLFLRDRHRACDEAESVVSRSWRQHDLVVLGTTARRWHRARRFDRNEVRDMRRTTLRSEVPIVGVSAGG